MRKITIFGGSFNPIHNGHLAIARAMVQQGLCDELWLMVTPQNPFKRNAQLLPDRLRLQMAAAAVAEDPQIIASDYEFALPKPTYTYQTLRRLRAEHPDCEFSVLIGSDNWSAFDLWSHPQEILAYHKVFVYPRQGDAASTAKEEKCVLQCVNDASSHHSDILSGKGWEVKLLPISSTSIRARLAIGQDVSGDVPAPALKLLLDYLQKYPM